MDFESSKAIFDLCIKEYPNDKACKFLRSRCERFLENGAPKLWNEGVEYTPWEIYGVSEKKDPSEYHGSAFAPIRLVLSVLFHLKDLVTERYRFRLTIYFPIYLTGYFSLERRKFRTIQHLVTMTSYLMKRMTMTGRIL
jgi:hypothetical protein